MTLTIMSESAMMGSEISEDYCLVMMPHVAVLHPQPSLGLGLLQAILRQSGLRGRVVIWEFAVFPGVWVK